jgi:hypothetical protein
LFETFQKEEEPSPSAFLVPIRFEKSMYPLNLAGYMPPDQSKRNARNGFLLYLKGGLSLFNWK